MPRWYGQRGRMHAIIGDASLMAAHAGHPPSRGRLRRGSCYESQKPRLVQKGWDMLLQHAMRFRRCQWVSCGRRAARDSPTPSTRQGTLRLGAADPAGFYLKRFSPPAGYGLLLFFLSLRSELANRVIVGSVPLWSAHCPVTTQRPLDESQLDKELA